MTSALHENESLATDTSVPSLEVVGLSSGYEGTTVLRDVNLRVRAGGVSALVGPNGAGKTTLLKSIAGLIRPSAGSVLHEGEDISSLRPHQRDARGICMIPEGRGIFRSLTVEENLFVQAGSKREQSRAVERGTEAFPILGQRLRQQAGSMSGGQQQMLAFARAYVRNPKLILVDEASLGLAPVVVDTIFDFLGAVTQAGAALLIVDQFITRALELADTAYVLRQGEIVFSGTSAQLQSDDIFERYLGSDA